MKAQALIAAGQAYMDLRRLELAPALTREVAQALSNGQFVNFGTGAESAAASGSNDVMRVVQTLLAAQVITRSGGGTPPSGTPTG
jgi:acyl CoA:acetate/3-ketoacid CoA transferase beta subunit